MMGQAGRPSSRYPALPRVTLQPCYVYVFLLIVLLGQAGRPSSHYPALPRATLQPCYVCLYREIMHKLF